MPRKVIVVDYQACSPDRCPEGRCQALRLCERKVLTQPARGHPPEVKQEICLGCGDCLPGCSQDALHML